MQDFIDVNTIPEVIWFMIAEFLAPKDFFSLRLTSTLFKQIAENQHFIWEPRKISSDTTRTLEFNLGSPPNPQDSYYLAAQHGEFRWPGGSLLMCRSSDHAIEVKELHYNFKAGTVQHTNVFSLIGHSSKITTLLSCDPNSFVSGDESGVIIVWEQDEQGFVKTQLKTHPDQQDVITAITRPSKGKLITGDNAGRLSYWSSYNETPRWQLNLGKPIVNIKIVPKTKSCQIDVACLNAEKEIFEITRYQRESGTVVKKLPDLKFDPLNSQYRFACLLSSSDNMYSEFRSDTTVVEERSRTTLNCWNSKAQPNEESYKNSGAYFRPSKNINEFFNYQTTPLSNGNILFWKQNGDARLFFQKRAPICVSTPDKPRNLNFLQSFTALTRTPPTLPLVEEVDEVNEENLIY